jgi:hypothetical protein
VSADKQNIVTGVLLLISVVVPNGADTVRRLRARLHRMRASRLSQPIAPTTEGRPTA